MPLEGISILLGGVVCAPGGVFAPGVLDPEHSSVFAPGVGVSPPLPPPCPHSQGVVAPPGRSGSGSLGPPQPPSIEQAPLCTAWPPSLRSLLSALLELSAYGLLLYGSIRCFGLEINWEKRLLDSKVGASRGLMAPWPPPAQHLGPLYPLGLLSDIVGFPLLQPSPTTNSRRGCGR